MVGTLSQPYSVFRISAMSVVVYSKWKLPKKPGYCHLSHKLCLCAGMANSGSGARQVLAYQRGKSWQRSAPSLHRKKQIPPGSPSPASLYDPFGWLDLAMLPPDWVV